MKFGIITGCQRQKFFKKPTIIEHENYTVLELPYTLEQMREVTERKLLKALEKGVRVLLQSGIQRAVLANSLKEIFDTNIRMENFRVFDGSLMFFDFVPRMVDWLCEQHEFVPPNVRIGIREQNLSKISRGLIEKLCYQSKYMNLATGGKVSAKRYSDFLLENFGFMLEIRDITLVEEFGDDESDIIIDIDNQRVTAPKHNTAINGFVVEDLEIPDDTDMFDIIACLGLKPNDVSIEKYVDNAD